jgi:hypothetical protein
MTFIHRFSQSLSCTMTAGMQLDPLSLLAATWILSFGTNL